MVNGAVWVLTGPTCSGKSSLAMELAATCRLEILSMDSMAVYRRMDIGTAKPDQSQLRAVPHHLIDLVEPSESFDTHRYCTHADDALAGVRSGGAQPLFVGGTPLYLMAFFKALNGRVIQQLEAAPREIGRWDPTIERTPEAKTDAGAQDPNYLNK